MITLYRRNRIGVGTWRIWAEGSLIRMAHATVEGGQEVFHSEEVPAGLAGRSLEEQVASRVRSRVNRQLDKGYVEDRSSANLPVTNMLDQPPPMLAKKITDMRGWPGRSVIQPKLDGFRCMAVRNEDGKIVCYSRQGKSLVALAHIRHLLEPWLPPGVILDGEIYEHGKPLQAIASLAKREQAGTENLVYHVYDSVSEDDFLTRYSQAQGIVVRAAETSSRIVMVENRLVDSSTEVWDHFARYREMGYEGAMLRILHFPYESGTRSSGLLKVKSRGNKEYVQDMEFEVIDVVPGSDGLGILVMRMTSGKTFRTLAPGSHDQKRFVLAHKDRYIGSKVTVEYANLTEDGIPFHAVATRWSE